MQFSIMPLTGELIAKSFGNGVEMDFFYPRFCQMLIFDDKFVRSECCGYQICRYDITFHSYTYHESAENSVPKVVPQPSGSHRKVLMHAFHRDHWSVYCINLGQTRIDVLDSMEYNSKSNPKGGTTWDMHNSPMGKIVMQ
jgi:hypothetical protein